MPPLPAHCDPPPMHATRRWDGVIPRGRGPLSPAHGNIAIAYFPHSQVRDSDLQPFCAAVRSPLKRDESSCAGKLDEKRLSICRSCPGADTDVCRILEDAQAPG